MPGIGELQAGEAAPSSGYTLVELLVVLALIGLLISATPSIVSAARPGAEARATAYALADELRSARNSAILNNAERAVRLDVKAKTYAILPGGFIHRLPQAVGMEFRGTVDGPGDSTAELRFFPDGSSTGGTVRITSRGQDHWIVDHALSGRISVDE